MVETANRREVLRYFKALSDEVRLTILRLLSQREYGTGELAQVLGKSEPTVSHHLSKLRAVGLLSLRMDGNGRLYRVNTSALDKFKQMVLQIEQSPDGEAARTDAWLESLPFTEDERKILRGYTSDGFLTGIPMKSKKLLVVLRWLAGLFQPEVKYTEPQVNAILRERTGEYHVELRRYLIDYGFLRRERGGGSYWLTPENEG